MWRTILLGHQLSPWCPFLKRWNVMYCIQGLRQQSILHRPFNLPSGQCCSLYHFYRLCSNMSGSQALVKRSHSSGGTSIEDLSAEKLSSDNQISRTMEVLPSTKTKPPSEDLEDPPPLSPLDEISEDEALQIVAEPILPSASFTLRDYVDHSETLTKLLLLGVDLSKLERRRNVGTFLLRLDFEKDIKEKLLFLKDVGLEDSQLGPFLTKNPFILSEDMENLQTRVNYLASVKFNKEAIARIVTEAPYLLNFSVERVDNRLGFFQKELRLSAHTARDLIVRLPRLLTGSLEPIKENIKVCQLELGFRYNEIQHIVTTIPKILTMNKKKLTETFDYVHNKMNIPHHIICKFPQVFNAKLLRIKERHMFLMFLGRAQYDPAQASYVSLDKLVSLPDEVFCTDLAKASIQDFEKFLKTI
ncbi:transcription termination factor 3, mitochondrial isoform X2 [Microcaecilia unicolor]|nr:transcription termination factor 3, mitochondrial isoform X2 [Microcaecilia unicolor]XP_030072841.1 transcription termination factor 3, mitochondrial isoform X2 [Microcaecilia unicolor]XP_030072850.1 transcription termination factor 3, mitochondrial isoform X2 [Microcaecilia unicolor]